MLKNVQNPLWFRGHPDPPGPPPKKVGQHSAPPASPPSWLPPPPWSPATPSAAPAAAAALRAAPAPWHRGRAARGARPRRCCGRSRPGLGRGWRGVAGCAPGENMGKWMGNDEKMWPSLQVEFRQGWTKMSVLECWLLVTGSKIKYTVYTLVS